MQNICIEKQEEERRNELQRSEGHTTLKSAEKLLHSVTAFLSGAIII